MDSSIVSISDEQIVEALPLFEQLLGGQEQVERYDASVADHRQFPKNALYREYLNLRRYLRDLNFEILWVHRARFHCSCLQYCIENAMVVDVDGTKLEIDPVDYLSTSFSPEDSIAILNELYFVSQLPLDVDVIGLIVEHEKSDRKSPTKRPDILVQDDESEIFVECKRTMSKDNPSSDQIQEDIRNTVTSKKFRDEFYSGKNKHCVLQVLLPHAITELTNSQMREIVAEANQRALQVGDRSEYISSVVSTYYTLQVIEEQRTTLFGPQFVETTPEESDFSLGIQSEFREAFESNPVFDIAGIAE